MSKRVYVKPDNQAKIVCDCGMTKTIDLSRYGRRITEAKVKCKCGKVCSVIFEYRRHYRKKVELFGVIELSNEKRYDAQIHDISMSGIRFEIIGNKNDLIADFDYDIYVGAYVNITFRLDDAHKSIISRTIVIRRILDNDIGAEFCDNLMDKTLGFYLLP